MTAYFLHKVETVVWFPLGKVEDPSRTTKNTVSVYTPA